MLMVKYDELMVENFVEMEDDVYNIPLKEGGDLNVRVDGDKTDMFFVPPDIWELLEAGFTEDEAAPDVEMTSEDEQALITYLRKAVAR